MDAKSIIRFKAGVNVAGPNECWEWTRSKNHDGYGGIKISGQVRAAHRVAYELWTGPIPGGLCVLHTCDNPPCCNPSHLWLGTRIDNNRDKVQKGRSGRGHKRNQGTKNGRAIISEDDVRSIRRLASKLSRQELGTQYGVHPRTVSNIIRRETWRHI